MVGLNHYVEATPQSLFNELKDLETEIARAGRGISRSARRAARTKADYEKLKNEALIQMFAEEAASGKKRTVDQRQSIYRTTYSVQRFAAQAAENEWKASVDYLKALLGNQISTEVRLKIIESEMRFAGGRNA